MYQSISPADFQSLRGALASHIDQSGACVPPVHFVISMDPGSRRDSLLDPMVELLRAEALWSFLNGFDQVLSVTFDGSLPQLHRIFFRVDLLSGYSNGFCGLLAMDITALSHHLEEVQAETFLNRCRELCQQAHMIFFVQAPPSRSEERLLAQLEKVIPDLRRVLMASGKEA